MSNHATLTVSASLSTNNPELEEASHHAWLAFIATVDAALKQLACARGVRLAEIDGYWPERERPVWEPTSPPLGAGATSVAPVTGPRCDCPQIFGDRLSYHLFNCPQGGD